MRSAKHTVIVLALVGGLLALVSLAGATDPTCEPATPGEAVCLTAADCEGLVHLACAGQWQCVDATCDWTCQVTDPGCYGDGDCAADEQCTADTLCLAPPDCPMCAVCWGHCVKASCVYDTDCAKGQACVCDVTCPPCAADGTCAACTNACACAVLTADADADGWLAPQDCDDTDAAVSPAASEACGNSVDDDCDGLVDEQCWPCGADSDCPSYWQCASHTWCPPCVEALGCKVACQAWSSCEPVLPYPEPCAASSDGSQACPAGNQCQCLAMPDCPFCDGCYWGCVPAEEPPCGGTQPGTCGADLTCQCRPPADCPLCDVCDYGCYPADGRCRSDADCGFGSTCDVTGTPDYCGMIMGPVLPPACWGVCAACANVCPAVMCAVGQAMDPCTCKCQAS